MFHLNKNKIVKHKQYNKGMTYVELIVVLGIFSLMSTVITFNYGFFQSKVDTKNLGNEIALKIVEAQKAALSGKLPTTTVPSTWKPSYGIYFDSTNSNDSNDSIFFNKKFIYFTDLDSDGIYDGLPHCTTTECLGKVSIPKGSYISAIQVFGTVSATPSNLTATFSRVNSGVNFTSNGTALAGAVSYVQITVISPKGGSALIKIYPSGRVQMN
ncbi:MAG: type II secretion system protein [Patescibacteria group bacterium]